jgi:hypothetical protein
MGAPPWPWSRDPPPPWGGISTSVTGHVNSNPLSRGSPWPSSAEVEVNVLPRLELHHGRHRGGYPCPRGGGGGGPCVACHFFFSLEILKFFLRAKRVHPSQRNRWPRSKIWWPGDLGSQRSGMPGCLKNADPHSILKKWKFKNG